MTTTDNNKTDDIDNQDQNQDQDQDQIQKHKTQSSRDDINNLIVTGFLVMFVEMIPIMFLFGGFLLVAYMLYFIISNIYKASTNQ
jgi:hypothetical protein